jgi:hypothetical protein
MQRSCADVNSPYKRKCWINLVNALLWDHIQILVYTVDEEGKLYFRYKLCGHSGWVKRIDIRGKSMLLAALVHSLASASRPIPPASAFLSPASESDTKALRCQTESIYSGTGLFLITAIFHSWLYSYNVQRWKKIGFIKLEIHIYTLI